MRLQPSPRVAVVALGAGGAAAILYYYYYQRRQRAPPGVVVGPQPFDDATKAAVMGRMKDGEKDFLGFVWDMWKREDSWTLYRADLDGSAAGVFFAHSQGRDEYFLNGLRTDATIRRRGIATALIRGMDADLAAKGADCIRMATTSQNDPMLTLCKTRLHLEPIKFRMCQCNALSSAPMRATKAKAEMLDALWAFVTSSDYFEKAKGLMQAGPGQFRGLTRAALEEV